VRFGGITRDVCLECQPDAVVGDFVLVHVGFAIARIDRQEAARAWAVLTDIGQTDEIATPEVES
jgi:hydrogenase expression/formation protein HypC